MTWSTNETEYEGFPLLLRKPDHKDVWKFKRKFVKLVSIEHHLSKVESNGLPESGYNKSLADFDNHMCNLMDDENGISILIETFSGMRNYYYYVLPVIDIVPLLDAARLGFDVELTAWEKIDPEWDFLDTYPIEVFCK